MILIRSQETVGDTPYQHELNEVVSAVAGTGVITLKHKIRLWLSADLDYSVSNLTNGDVVVVENITVSGIEFDGNDEASGNQNIYLNFAKDVLIDNVVSHNSGTNGIAIGNSFYVTVRGSRFYKNDNYGIHVYGSENCNIKGNYVYDHIDQWNIYIEEPSGWITVDNNHVWGGEQGMMCKRSYSITITDNIFTSNNYDADNDGADIISNSSKFVTIVGNTCNTVLGANGSNIVVYFDNTADNANIPGHRDVQFLVAGNQCYGGTGTSFASNHYADRANTGAHNGTIVGNEFPDGTDLTDSEDILVGPNRDGGTITRSGNSNLYEGLYALYGSTTWNPGDLADGAGETKSLTVTGAALGDAVIVSSNVDLQDMI
jgi:parallel beta-helix repeat protein